MVKDHPVTELLVEPDRRQDIIVFISGDVYHTHPIEDFDEGLHVDIASWHLRRFSIGGPGLLVVLLRLDELRRHEGSGLGTSTLHRRLATGVGTIGHFHPTSYLFER